MHNIHSVHQSNECLYEDIGEREREREREREYAIMSATNLWVGCALKTCTSIMVHIYVHVYTDVFKTYC